MTPLELDALFYNDAIYEQRYRKAALGLLAVYEALSERRPLGTGNEAAFLHQVEWLQEQPDEAFGRVWQDPTAFWWVRNAYHLVAVIAGTVEMTVSGRDLMRAFEVTDAKAALDIHLGLFARFVLGVAVCADVARSLHPAVDVRLPFVVPGTRLVLDGEGQLQIRHYADGLLDVTIAAGQPARIALTAGTEQAGLRVREAVALPGSDDAPVLLPELYGNLPGLAFASALDGIGEDFQRRHAGCVVAALAHIRRYAPDVGRALLDHTWCMALKPVRAGGFTNMAYSELPGTFVVAAVPNALELADTLIHEFHHDLLFFLDDAGPFFRDDGPDPLLEERFYSPWRPDPRPLHGLLHGAFVYTPVNDFWRQALASGELHGADRDYALDRLVRGIAQVHIGVRQLERHACLTELGDAVLTAIRQRLDACRESARGLADADARWIPALVCGEDGVYARQTARESGEPLSLADALAQHIEVVASATERSGVQGDLADFLATTQPVAYG